MTQEQIADNERLRQLASDFLGGQPCELVSQETLAQLLVMVSIRSAQDTLERIKRDMFAVTMPSRPAFNPGRRKIDTIA